MPKLPFSRQHRDAAARKMAFEMAATSSTGAQQNIQVDRPPKTLRRQKARIGQETKTVVNSTEISSNSSSASRSNDSGRTLVSCFSDTSSEGSITSQSLYQVLLKRYKERLRLHATQGRVLSIQFCQCSISSCLQGGSWEYSQMMQRSRLMAGGDIMSVSPLSFKAM